LLDGDVPIDNNHIENQMRPWALGRRNWLFVGSERAAMIMSLLQSAKLNKIEQWVYLKDVLTRFPTQLNSKLDELLPHLWKPAIAG
jgi:transposase